VEGVNHCSLHCRLATFRGMRRRGKSALWLAEKEPIA